MISSIAWVIGVAAVLIIAVIVWAVWGSQGSGRSASVSEKLPYEREESLLSKSERAFYVVLNQAVGRKYQVFAKVRMIDIVRVARGVERAQVYKNRIIQKHVDFVLCSREGLVPLLVVELDDASHRGEKARGRDAEKDAIFAAAGLPVMRVVAASGYGVEELAGRVRGALAAGNAAVKVMPRPINDSTR